MHTNILSFTLLGLAAQALLSAASPHRLLPANIHAPLNHQRLHARHELPYERRHVAGKPLLSRDPPASTSPSTQTLQSEVTTFTNWMSTFLASPNATNSADSIAQVKEEVQTHATAVSSFISSATGIDTGSISQLQSELTVFQGWADAWCNGASTISSTDAIAQLKTEVQSYEGWLAAWLSNVSGGAPAPVAAPAPVPAPAPAVPQVSSTTEAAPSPSTQAVVPPSPKPEVPQPHNGYKPEPEISSSSSSAAAEAPSPVVPAYQAPPQQPEPTTTTTPTPSPQAASPPSGYSPSQGSGSGFGYGSGSTGSTSPSTGSDHPKLAAWWGQTAAASSEGLASVCADDAFDVVIIAFLTNYFGPGGYPSLNLGPSAAACSEKQTAAGASGLLDGSTLAPAIKTCQANGKKVLLSLGGAAASGSAHSGTGAPTSVFGSDQQGQQFAQTLWDLFLGGQSPLRPFGDIKLDGIDMDSEAGDTTGYGAFATAMRGKFSADASKSYYLSAAPQCPMPDQSIPVEALHLCDWVWVQFYNNGKCNHGAGSTFTDSVSQWSQNLSGSNAKLYVAAIASGNQGSGFIDADALAAEAAEVKKMGLANFGGYALWDASLAIQAGGMHTKVRAALS